jgi:hypothetical protein
MLTGAEDIRWALRECDKASGFCPHAKSTVDLLYVMERDGLVRQSEVGPFWHITDAGRVALTNGDRQ